MRPLLSPHTQRMGLDTGLLLLRVSLGLIFLYHGSQKLFGLFDGPGLSATAEGFAKMGLPVPFASALAASTSETLGGVLLIPGLFTRLASAALTFTMLVGVLSTRQKGFDVRSGGFEYALSLGLTLAALTLAGPGHLALDALLFRRKRP